MLQDYGATGLLVTINVQHILLHAKICEKGLVCQAS